MGGVLQGDGGITDAFVARLLGGKHLTRFHVSLLSLSFLAMFSEGYDMLALAYPAPPHTPLRHRLGARHRQAGSHHGSGGGLLLSMPVSDATLFIPAALPALCRAAALSLLRRRVGPTAASP